MQKQPEHDEDEIVGVEIRNRDHPVLARKFVDHPTKRQEREQDRENGGMFEPFSRLLGRRYPNRVLA